MSLLLLVYLMVRRHRVLLASWLVLLVAMSGGTVSAYQSTYTTPDQRRIATELAQHNAATTLLYGNLADPGSPALMFSWEIGAFATILAAIMAVLVATALTRATEDDGTLELVRSSGVDPRLPLRAALTVLLLVAVSLAAGCAAAAGVSVGHVDGVTWPGAVAFGAVVGLTFLLVGVLTVVLAQVAPTAGGTRVLGFAAVGAAFVVRAIADTQHLAELNWITPLGLRATVRPFAQTRWWVLATAAVVALALAQLATVLSSRREYRAGLLRQRDRRDTRLNVRSVFGLTRRLSRPSLVTWTVAVAVIGTLFSAMGSGVTQQSRNGDLGGFLGAQLGTGDPIAGFFAYSGTVVGMMVATYAVLSVLRSRHDEADGLIDTVLATGIRRWTPLASQVAVTALGSAVILVTTGALTAVVAPRFINGSDVAILAFAYVVGQWPAAMAAAGWTALLVGRWPRATWLSWVPLVVGGTFALLGQLLGIPQRIRDLGIFQHVPDVTAPNPNGLPLLVLLTLAAGACLLGAVGTTRRDMTTG
jgi:ABC-2 type transport system permease protein